MMPPGLGPPSFQRRGPSGAAVVDVPVEVFVLSLGVVVGVGAIEVPVGVGFVVDVVVLTGVAEALEGKQR